MLANGESRDKTEISEIRSSRADRLKERNVSFTVTKPLRSESGIFLNERCRRTEKPQDDKRFFSFLLRYQMMKAKNIVSMHLPF